METGLEEGSTARVVPVSELAGAAEENCLAAGQVDRDSGSYYLGRHREQSGWLRRLP